MSRVPAEAPEALVHDGHFKFRFNMVAFLVQKYTVTFANLEGSVGRVDVYGLFNAMFVLHILEGALKRSSQEPEGKRSRSGRHCASGRSAPARSLPPYPLDSISLDDLLTPLFAVTACFQPALLQYSRKVLANLGIAQDPLTIITT